MVNYITADEFDLLNFKEKIYKLDDKFYYKKDFFTKKIEVQIF